jgi:hypothetical protein
MPKKPKIPAIMAMTRKMIVHLSICLNFRGEIINQPIQKTCQSRIGAFLAVWFTARVDQTPAKDEKIP